ncbi:hypothetical protein BC830DRAFT_755855 [Chytriomyces sp. MP71]|nr:hypothetical protein BC830DRAFT_755855 [Chytriomyces sp. MP71]
MASAPEQAKTLLEVVAPSATIFIFGVCFEAALCGTVTALRRLARNAKAIRKTTTSVLILVLLFNMVAALNFMLYMGSLFGVTKNSCFGINFAQNFTFHMFFILFGEQGHFSLQTSLMIL